MWCAGCSFNFICSSSWCNLKTCDINDHVSIKRGFVSWHKSKTFCRYCTNSLYGSPWFEVYHFAVVFDDLSYHHPQIVVMKKYNRSLTTLQQISSFFDIKVIVGVLGLVWGQVIYLTKKKIRPILKIHHMLYFCTLLLLKAWEELFSVFLGF